MTIATEIITRTEPASLLAARHRWHRAQQDCRAAKRAQRSDAEAAAVAAQNWCSLVDIYATPYAASHATTLPTTTARPPLHRPATDTSRRITVGMPT